MVTILPKFDPYGDIGGSLGAGLGSGLSQGVGQYFERKNEQRRADELQRIISGLTPEQQQDPFALIGALAKYPDQAKLLINDLSTRKRIENTGSGGFYSSEEFETALDKLGLPDEQKQAYKLLYKNAPVGGKTAITKSILSELDRVQAGGSINPENLNIPPLKTGDNESLQLKETETKFPELDTFKGLTRTQKQARENQLRKENSKIYQDNSSKLKSLKQEDLALKKLDKINDSGKLPKLIGQALNVNLQSGELRVPFLANAQTQEFVKIINDFTTKAKDSYGARVTNFELDRFLRRLPSLLNTEDGRRSIISYMKSVNDLNKLHSNALDEVFNHYKISNLTSQDAEHIAQNLIKNKEDEILENALDADAKAQQIFDLKQKAKPGEILMEYQGKFIFVPENETEEAQKQGAKLI